MNTQKLALIFLIACMVLSCGKSKVDNPIEDPTENPGDRPDPVAHGTPIGDAVQKSIGTGGGTIAMPDNGISVSIPAGALAAETTFSIQEVSSTIGANGLGKSYRLLPENVQFKQDVEITFAYKDSMLAGKFEDLLFMAYQDAKGYWRVPKNTVQDKANKTLKVKTRHFSDWSGYCSAYLTAEKNELHEKEETILKGSYCFNVKDMDDLSLADLLMGPKYTAIDEWKIISGNGAVVPASDGTATYLSPAYIPDFSSATIQVTFKNLRHPNTGEIGEISVDTKIKLLPEVYFEWTFDGQERISLTPVAKYVTSTNGNTHLRIDVTSRSKQFLTIKAVISDENTYPFSPYAYDIPGTVSVWTLDAGSFEEYSPGCKLAMTGYVDFESVDLDKYIKGTVFGTLIRGDSYGAGCNVRKPISGSFRVKAPK